MLIKTSEEIKKIKDGGKIIGRILGKLAEEIKAGMSTFDVDEMAERMIAAEGGRPAFKGYKTRSDEKPFPGTICASLNSELVHGIPNKKIFLKNGDVFSIDIGMEWPAFALRASAGKPVSSRGYFTDTAITLPIGKIPEKTKELLRVARRALEAGIRAAKPGKSVADVGRAIENYVNSQGKYGIIRDLVGHGVGHEVHEEPRIPNYYDRSLEKFILRPGMVIALEPMISLGDWRVKTSGDGWAIEMADGSLCAHFEHTIIITKNGNFTATRRPLERLI